MWEAKLPHADILSIKIFSSYFLNPAGTQERTEAVQPGTRPDMEPKHAQVCREQLWQAAVRTEQGLRWVRHVVRAVCIQVMIIV